MSRLEMINFIKKYSDKKYDFTQYDDSDLFQLCGRLTITNKEAKRELYEGDWAFNWYWTMIDWFADGNKIRRTVGWVLLLLFNPALIILYVVSAIVILLHIYAK